MFLENVGVRCCQGGLGRQGGRDVSKREEKRKRKRGRTYKYALTNPPASHPPFVKTENPPVQRII